MTDKQYKRLEELENFLKKNNIDDESLIETMINKASVFISSLPVQVSESEEKRWIDIRLLDEALDVHVLDVIANNQFKLSVEDVLIICLNVQENKEYFLENYDEIMGYDDNDDDEGDE